METRGRNLRPMIPSFPFVFVCASCVCLCCLCLFGFVCVIDTSRKVESKEGRLEKLAGRKRRPLILSFASPPLHTNTQLLHTNTQHNCTQILNINPPHKYTNIAHNCTQILQRTQHCTQAITHLFCNCAMCKCEMEKDRIYGLK